MISCDIFANYSRVSVYNTFCTNSSIKTLALIAVLFAAWHIAPIATANVVAPIEGKPW